MLFSHKPSQLPSFVPSFLAGSPIDLVSTFKYLGVLLIPTLFWPTHICSRSRKILGIIFPAALLQILLSYHSHSPVHLPHSPYSRALCLCRIPLPNLSFILESILNRTSKFIPSLIPNLSASHSISSWSIIAITPKYQPSSNLVTIPGSLTTPHPSRLKFLPCTPYPIRSYHFRNLSPLSGKFASLTKSYFASSILLWNAIHSDIKESSSLSIFSKNSPLTTRVN